jgi:hypothetical protein
MQGRKGDFMSRWSGYQAAIKRNVVTIMVMVGLLAVAACAAPPRNLSDPAKFKTIEHALTTDLTKVVHDLNREKHDARADPSGRQESQCYNLKNNVNYVVLNTIRTFVIGTVSADRNSLESNINHMRRDRSDFEQDIFDFINDGVARPAGAQRAIRNITTKIRQAKENANHTILAVNQVVRNAYHLANGLATGSCIGDGPGNQMPRVAPLT